MKFFNAFLLSLGLAMLAIVPTRAATPPVVVVYPFLSSDSTPSSAGVTLAHVLAAQVAQGGDVVVKTPPENTPQSDYLSTARSLNADYYLAGQTSSVGSQVSAVEQLVSTTSGVSVWRNSAMYSVPDEARATGTQIHDFVLQAYTLPSYSAQPSGAAPPPPSPPHQAPPPDTQRQKPAAPLPIPASFTDTPEPVAGPRVVVIDFGGSVIDAVKHYAPASVIRTLPAAGMQGVRADATSDDIATNGILICAQAGADQLITGTVDGGQPDPEQWQYSALVKMQVYDCRNMSKKPLQFERSVSNGNLQTAIDIAISYELKDLAYQLKTGKS